MKRRSRADRVFRALLWGGLGAWALGLAAFYLTRAPRPAPRPGQQVLAPEMTGRSVRGGDLPLLPRDSVVAVLAATSECGACRLGLPQYRAIAERLKRDGVAFRVIVGSDSLAARQFSRFLPEPGAAVWDPRQKLLRELGVRSVPTLYLVGRDGRLVKSWVPLDADERMVEVIAGEARAAR